LDDEFARAANVAANEPDYVYWTKVVGGFESNNAVTYTDGKGMSRETSNPNAPNMSRWGMEDQDTGNVHASYYLAGMAYWANTHDIRGAAWNDEVKRRPGMRVTTYVLDVNEFGNDSITGNRRNTQFFLAAKYGGFKDRSGTGNPFMDARGATDNSNWQKSAEPGEARTYFLSSSARTVLRSLDDIFDSITSEGNSIAGGAISTQRLSSAGAFVYLAQFDPESWSGDLLAYTMRADDSTRAVTLADAQPQWRAAARLDLKDVNNRKIFVGKTTADSQGAATAFTWDAIETPLKDALDRPTPSSTPDGLGQLRLQFLRGDRSGEGTTFRTRSSRLGDIVSSAVLYSGEPTRTISNDTFRAFHDAHKGRVSAVFVGANDGMLHAFNANTGDELFAYIPSWMGSRLSALTLPGYNSGGHQSYVDASPTTGEAEVGGVVKTVLVQGTGGGGQGVFALDVTDPADFDASKVMWEFTDRDDPNVGNVIGRPQILKLRTSAPGGSQYKWFAVFASGVNNYVDDGHFSTTGRPALFLLDLSKPVGSAWVEGTNYYKISLPVDSALAATKPTGLVGFRATGGLNGEVAQIYAGDLHGRVWKLDFTKVGTADWTVDKLSPYKNGGTALPLFIATDSSGAPQPITMEPMALYGPNNGTIVTFGTGKYMEAGDNTVNTITQVQSVYALYDDGTANLDIDPPGNAAISGRRRLQAGSLSGYEITVSSFAWGRALTDDDATQRSGWYFDFPRAGERQISAFSVFGSSITFGSIVPPTVAGSDVCGGGSGYQYTLNIATGSGTNIESTVGMLGSPWVLQVGADSVTTSNSVGRRVATTTGQVILQGSAGLRTASPQLTSAATVGRLSWRQINNYHELKNAP
ncbi:MAG TPA: PilC/PilY family type IV pilus protein, partial [Burkholderiaceae bacterium]|nr:PilC/PilY family type IV pilus protein [Burkholderiaceae bacterium]